MPSPLSEVLAKYNARLLDDYPVLPVFPGDELEESEVAPEEGEVERDYELPLDRWGAIPSREGGGHLPTRYIDGTIVARTVGALTDPQGRQRPMLLAVIGAAALELDSSVLTRREMDFEVETLLAMITKGLKDSDLHQMTLGLEDLGLRFLQLPARTLSTDFELARAHTFDGAREEMLQAERRLMLAGLDQPTLVDGVLEDRLGDLDSWDVPIVGVVKRLLRIRHHLHQAGINLVYTLRPGERTPAIVLQTKPKPYMFKPVVSWFLRLSGEGHIAPSWGVVRVAIPQEYFEGTLGKSFEAINEISGWLYTLRCRDRSYARMPVSLEPIVRVEEHLQALRPSLDAAVGHFAAAAELR